MKGKNLGLFISVIAFLVIGITALIIYNEINGLRFIDMLTSKYGLTIIIVICVYSIIVGLYLLLNKIRNM